MRRLSALSIVFLFAGCAGSQTSPDPYAAAQVFDDDLDIQLALRVTAKPTDGLLLVNVSAMNLGMQDFLRMDGCKNDVQVSTFPALPPADARQTKSCLGYGYEPFGVGAKHEAQRVIAFDPAGVQPGTYTIQAIF